jgi:hypothetical protein
VLPSQRFHEDLHPTQVKSPTVFKDL